MAISTLGYALLGLLAREELSGYELAQQLRHPLGYFWQARHSQIYPELARLEADGLAQHQPVAQRDRPDKKVFSITAAGREALAAWVSSPMDMVPVRDELVLKAFSLWLADPAAAARVFTDQAERHRERMAHFASIVSELEAASPRRIDRIGTPDFASYATLRLGVGYEREYAAWCEWLASRLSAAD